MTAIEKICESLTLLELEELNGELPEKGRPVFLQTIKKMEQKLEEERITNMEKMKKNNEKMEKTLIRKVEWTEEHLQLLIKAVNLFPAGTNQRWEIVANFINQHGNFDNASSKFNAKDVLNKAKDLQNTDFSKSNLKVAANKQAYSNFEKDKQNARVLDKTEISEKIDNKIVITNGNNNDNSNSAWTPNEQLLLEQALKTYSASTPDRWDRISECIPSRTKKECMKRYKELVELVKAKKAAQMATPVPTKK